MSKNVRINLKQTLNPSYKTHKNQQDEEIPEKYSDQWFKYFSRSTTETEM